MKRHYFIDLDGTLVDTSGLGVYRKTERGNRYLLDNMQHLAPPLVHQCLLELVRDLHRKSKVSVITNASFELAQAMLSLHGFPADLPLYAIIKKPLSDSLETAIRTSGVLPQHALVIGDEAVDILAAHGCNAASVGVSWGHRSTVDQLEQAEPQEIVPKPENLEDVIARFEKGEISYCPRKKPGHYLFLPAEEYSAPVPAVSNKSMGSYWPYVPGEPAEYRSGLIMRYKRSRDVLLERIMGGVSDQYFGWKGIRSGGSYQGAISFFIDELSRFLRSKKPDGTAYLIAAPNSYPEFCYRTDINQFVVDRLVETVPWLSKAQPRIISRVYPKAEAHLHGRTSPEEHYRTIGLKKDCFAAKPEHIIIFDDVRTTGTGLECIAKILQHFGFGYNFYSLTLGETMQKNS